MRFVLPPVRRPRHPLARILMAALGLAVLGVFMVFGLIALAVLVSVGAIMLLVRQWKIARAQRHRPRGAKPGSRQADAGQVLEGEYVVIRESRHAHTHH